MVFIVTVLLLAADFYYVKNIAGRRLVALRWWNEANLQTGDSRWVFESAEPGSRDINATDRRFFWLAMYAQPALWIVLAVVACVKLNFISLTLVGELTTRGNKLSGKGRANGRAVIALVLTITNTTAFSRCDKFSHATSLAGRALSTGGLAQNIAGGLFSRMFRG